MILPAVPAILLAGAQAASSDMMILSPSLADPAAVVSQRVGSPPEASACSRTRPSSARSANARRLRTMIVCASRGASRRALSPMVRHGSVACVIFIDFRSQGTVSHGVIVLSARACRATISSARNNAGRSTQSAATSVEMGSSSRQWRAFRDARRVCQLCSAW
jgi:hypothetical protein